jgi:hypothetical protein
MLPATHILKGQGKRAKGKGTAPASPRLPASLVAVVASLRETSVSALVPKLHLGTHLPGQLSCPRAHKVNGSPKPASTPLPFFAIFAPLRETFPRGKGQGPRAKGKGTALFPLALKGPPNIAQGETLGFAVQTESQALKGRPKSSLVPKLHLGTHLPGQLRCPRAHEGSSVVAQRPQPSHSHSRRPVRAAIIQPRVEARACPSFYPGFASRTEPTLKGLNPLSPACESTLSGLVPSMNPTQGRRSRANPGLNDHNPVGVVGSPLVPKLQLGTHLPGQLRCPRAHKVNGSPKSASTPLPFALFPLPFSAPVASLRETSASTPLPFSLHPFPF